jgi:hypothetical protein
LLGLKHGLLIGIAAGLISFVLCLGSLSGLVISTGVAIAQFWPHWAVIDARIRHCASRSSKGSALAKGLTQMKHDVSVIPMVACCDSKVVQCFAVHCLCDAGVGESLSDLRTSKRHRFDWL